MSADREHDTERGSIVEQADKSAGSSKASAFDSRQEPDEVILQVRICAGGVR